MMKMVQSQMLLIVLKIHLLNSNALLRALRLTKEFTRPLISGLFPQEML
ncbi:uncharacterized protein 2c [SARS coronavirus ZJ0301]|uniref:Uncharacterized protein 2c n=1 Tax=SARS coronavirus ZJ0301 TaxID=344702 RepID=Q3S2D0_SARS|nr:uncharacterized protein 2c [SARS coronavirus ZJ0301]